MMRFIPLSLILWVMVQWPIHAQSGFNGTFLAVVEGMNCQLITQTSHNTISGSYDEGGLRLQVIGTFYGKRANGDLKDPNSGRVVATFKAFLISANSLDLTFSISGQERSHVFLREIMTASQSNSTSTTITHDQQLPGNWTHQVITGGNGTSLETILYFQISADGSYAQYSRSVGGGTAWSYDSGQLDLQQQGMWYTRDNVLYIKGEGQQEYIAAATYRLSDEKLITEDIGGQKIWVRE